MTYGEQFARLANALMWANWAAEAKKRPLVTPRVKVTGSAPEVGVLKPYKGDETLAGGDPADWSWHGPDGRIEE